MLLRFRSADSVKESPPVSPVLARYGAKLAEDVERSIQRTAAEKVQDACKVVAIPDYKSTFIRYLLPEFFNDSE